MATFYTFTPDYWQRARAARVYAMDVIAELQAMPGGFGIGPSFLDGVDAPNGDHQRRITANLQALNSAELRTISFAIRPDGPGVAPMDQPWQQIVNLENATDMAAGWIARLIKQAGGVPHV